MEPTQILALVLGGGFSAAFVSGIIQLILWRWNRKAAKADKAGGNEMHIKNALRILLYDRIKYLGRRYIEQGYVPADDLEDLMAMHKCYHDDLDGNGFLDSIMGQVKLLPLKK